MDRNAALTYVAVKRQTGTKHTAIKPDVFVPPYSATPKTVMNMMSDTPAHGTLYATYQTLAGQREHPVAFSVMAEPNSMARILGAIMKKGSTTGSGPYTHPYTVADSDFLTMDFGYVSQAVRVWGIQLSKLAFGWEEAKMVLNGEGEGLHSFISRSVASVSGSGTYTLTLKTDYDPSPTDGLVVGDSCQIYDISANAYIAFTVASIVNSTQITTSTDISVAVSGDILTLAPATPSFNLLQPFLWPTTQFFFDDTAALAFTASSTASNQRRLEPGTEISLNFPFDDSGKKRSGSFDPESRPRKRFIANFSPKVYLDKPDDFNNWQTMRKRACVVRSYVGTYELRITLNKLIALTDEAPLASEGTILHEVAYNVTEDSTDGQALDIKLINNVAGGTL